MVVLSFGDSPCFLLLDGKWQTGIPRSKDAQMDPSFGAAPALPVLQGNHKENRNHVGEPFGRVRPLKRHTQIV